MLSEGKSVTDVMIATATALGAVLLVMSTCGIRGCSSSFWAE
jgi:hypothetical protein